MSTKLHPIYVITLKRTPERRLHMQRQLDALGLDYQFVDAIDQYDLQDSKYRVEIARLLGIDESVIEHKYFSMYVGSMACTLSHMKVYNLMAKHNNSVACVLEDDIVISPDFSKILQAAQKKSWDILMLSNRSCTIRNLLTNCYNIRKNIIEFSNLNCSLFPRARKVRWYRRWFLLVPASQSQLDMALIPKMRWYKLMIMSHSRTMNRLYNFIPAYEKRLKRFYGHKSGVVYKKQQVNEQVREHVYNKGSSVYIDCKIGGLPIRSSQQTLYRDYDIATPVEIPTSGMAYLLTLAAASKCKKMFTSKKGGGPIDVIPWDLHKNNEIQLRIVTPPCVSALLSYLKISAPQKNSWIPPGSGSLPRL